MTTSTPPRPAIAPVARGADDGIRRLALRTARGQGRHRFLVIALIAVTVAVGVAGGSIISTIDLDSTAAETADILGPADVTVSWTEDFNSGLRDPRPYLDEAQTAWVEARFDEEELHSLGSDDAVEVPAGSGVLLPSGLPTPAAGTEWLTWRQTSFTGSAAERLTVSTMDLSHPLAQGTFVSDHTGPLVGDEALASPAFLEVRGAAIGDTLRVGGIGEVRIVGTVQRASSLSAPVLVLATDQTLTGPFGQLFTRLRFADQASLDAWAPLVDPWYGRDGDTFVSEGFDVQVEPTAETDERTQIVGWDGRSWFRDKLESTFTPAPVLSGYVSSVFSVLLAGLTTFIVACALLVGLRRRLRHVGILGAAGAEPTQIRRLLRHEGLLLGLTGIGAGLVLGLIAITVADPILESSVGLDHPVDSTFPLTALIGPTVAGLLASVSAAGRPAAIGARIPVVTALAGRVPTPSLDLAVPVRGLLIMGAGFALLVGTTLGAFGTIGFTIGIPLGLILLLGGATSGTGALLAVGGRIAGRLPLAPRLALRDAARQRTRSTAAVGALTVLLLLPLGMGFGAVASARDDAMFEQLQCPVELDCIYPGNEEPDEGVLAIVGGPARFLSDGIPPSDAAIEVVTEALPTSGASAELIYLGPSGEWWSRLGWGPLERTSGGYLDVQQRTTNYSPALATPQLLDLLGIDPALVPAGGVLLVTDSLRDAPPSEGEGIVLDYDYAPRAVPAPLGSDDSAPDSTVVEPDPATTTHEVPSTIPWATVEGIGAPTELVLVHRALAEARGLTEAGRRTVLELTRPARRSETQAMYTTLESFGGWDFAVIEASTGGIDPDLMTGLIIAITLTLVLVGGVAWIIAALSAAESDPELAIALALGAPPSLRRRFHAALAWWHTTVAAVLGISVMALLYLGLARGTVSLSLTDVRNLLAVVAVVAGGIPLLAAGVVGATMRSTPAPARRRT